MATSLADAVIRITVDTLGIERGMRDALLLITNGVAQMTGAALASSSKIVQAFGLINAAALAAVVGVFALSAALVGLAKAGGSLEAALHNAEQTFGSFTSTVMEGAEQQRRAFGTARSEFLNYAVQVGRHLEMLGVPEAAAARMATDLATAVGRLAESRRVSFAEASRMADAEGRMALFSDKEVRALAFQKGLLHGRNQILDEGTAAILRQELAIEAILRGTENATGAGRNWTSQTARLRGELEDLAETIGHAIEPVFVAFLSRVNDLIRELIDQWDRWKFLIEGTTGPLGWLLGVGPAAPGAELDRQIAIDAQNEARIADERKRRQLGEVLGGGGGGGGVGFQGGAAEFARRVQQSAFSSRQVGLMREQLNQAIKMNAKLDRLVQGQQKPGAGGDAPWF